MKYSIVLTETAQADLSEIFRYIAVELQSMQNANRQLSRIEKALASLDQMPERYRTYDKKELAPAQYAYHASRQLPCFLCS